MPELDSNLELLGSADVSGCRLDYLLIFSNQSTRRPSDY